MSPDLRAAGSAGASGRTSALPAPDFAPSHSWEALPGNCDGTFVLFEAARGDLVQRPSEASECFLGHISYISTLDVVLKLNCCYAYQSRRPH